jgi:hypothetical protein
VKFILLLLISFPALADVKTCRDFVDKVLTPAVTLDEKAEDHGYRFVQNEEKALSFIRSYDSSKLQISEEMKLAEQEMNDCKVLMEQKNKDNYCGGLFENFNYLRGLIYGTKKYKWKPSTVQLAKKNVTSFIHESTIPGIPLIYIALSYSLLDDLSPSEKIKADRLELEKVISKLQADAKKNPTKECPGIQKAMRTERQEAEKFRAKLAQLIKEKKA